MIAEFAQIVGLMAAFASGREADETAQMTEFLEWLSQHNHEDLRKLVEQNQVTTVSIKAMLSGGFEEVNANLDNISRQLATLASRSDGIEALAESFATSLISEQAYRILSLMEENQSEFFLISKAMGTAPRLVLSPGPNYVADEPRFLHDDLDLLVSLGLLQLDYNQRGEPVYRYTRSASRLFQKRK